jgi:hypothetical protein
VTCEYNLCFAFPFAYNFIAPCCEHHCHGNVMEWKHAEKMKEHGRSINQPKDCNVNKIYREPRYYVI